MRKVNRMKPPIDQQEKNGLSWKIFSPDKREKGKAKPETVKMWHRLITEQVKVETSAESQCATGEEKPNEFLMEVLERQKYIMKEVDSTERKAAFSSRKIQLNHSKSRIKGDEKGIVHGEFPVMRGEKKIQKKACHRTLSVPSRRNHYPNSSAVSKSGLLEQNTLKIEKSKSIRNLNQTMMNSNSSCMEKDEKTYNKKDTLSKGDRGETKVPIRKHFKRTASRRILSCNDSSHSLARRKQHKPQQLQQRVREVERGTGEKLDTTSMHHRKASKRRTPARHHSCDESIDILIKHQSKHFEQKIGEVQRSAGEKVTTRAMSSRISTKKKTTR